MTPGRMRAVILAALLAGAGVIAVVLGSDHEETPEVWAAFGAAVGWTFIGTGLYAWRKRPESRIGALMVLLGFAWFLSTLESSNSPLLYTLALTVGGLWGSLFLHLGMSFPSGRLDAGIDRAIVMAGYVVFPLALAPSLMFAGPEEMGCACPANLLLIRPDETLSGVLRGAGALAYLALFVVVLVRAVRRWRSADELERVQLTPVYVCALISFLLVTAAQATGARAVWWGAFIATGLLPFAFLGSLLRTHVSKLDAELQAGLGELRELARGIHPAVLTDRGLHPALHALAARSPVPVTLDTGGEDRLPGPVESAAYFVVSEALTNVAKYARATHAEVTVRREDGRVTVEVADDGVGGADAARGSGLRGLADRVAALDGSLAVESPAGGGTRLRAEIPGAPPS